MRTSSIKSNEKNQDEEGLGEPLLPEGTEGGSTRVEKSLSTMELQGVHTYDQEGGVKVNRHRARCY